MTAFPQKWSMVIFQIMEEPFFWPNSKYSFQTQLLLYFNPKGNQRVPLALPLLRIQSKPDSMKFILTQNLKNYHAPKNLRSDHAPSKNKYDRVPPKMEHGHFSNYGGTLFLAKFQKHSFCYTSSFNTKGNQRVPLALPLSRIQSKPDSVKFILTLNFMTIQRGDTFDRTSCIIIRT